VDAILARFVTTGSHNAAFGGAAYEDWLTNKGRIKLPFNRYEERIQVNVYDVPFVFH
jgi:hypothetical protein